VYEYTVSEHRVRIKFSLRDMASAGARAYKGDGGSAGSRAPGQGVGGQGRNPLKLKTNY